MALPTMEQLSHAQEIADKLSIKINPDMLDDAFKLSMWCKSHQGKIIEKFGRDD